MHFHTKKERVSDTEQAGEIEFPHFLFFGSRREKLGEKIKKMSREMEAV